MGDETAAPVKKGESERHRSLKVLAGQWARKNGFGVVAQEVSFPHGRFRVDVAAYRPLFKVPSKVRFDGDIGITAVFECKQSRSDLIKDSRNQEKTLARLKVLVQRKTQLEALLKMHCPHLARGESLFPEFDSYDFDSLEHRSHSRVIREIRQVQAAACYKTKFDRLLRYKISHLHYLVLERGIIKPHEVPAGWGLLVRQEDGLALVEAPARQVISPAMQLCFLQRMAVSGNRSAATGWPGCQGP